MLKFKIVIVLASVLLFNGLFVSSVSASDTTLWGGFAASIQGHVGLGNDDPRNIAANIINIVLGFLGILSLLLIIYAGFKWMTAAGNEEQVTTSKKLLISAAIGLVIILSSYALAAFILDAVFRSTTSGNYVASP